MNAGVEGMQPPGVSQYNLTCSLYCKKDMKSYR